MIIVHVTPYYAPAWEWGGVVEAVSGLARAQAAAGHRVTVVTTDTLGPGVRGRAGVERIDGVDVRRVATRWPWLRAHLNLSWPRGFGRALDEGLRARPADVVHCHELRTVETLTAARAAAARGVPVVLSPHGTLPYRTGRHWAKRAWDAAFARRTWPCVDHIVALTQAEAADARVLLARLRDRHLEAACSVVPNGVDLDRYARLPDRCQARGRFGLPMEGAVVLFLGRLHRRKGAHLLVAARNRATVHGTPVYLLIAGPDAGMRETIQRQATVASSGGFVNMPGLLTGDDKLAAFAAADVFVLPAHGEGLSMAMLEALAAGVPVVAAREAPLLPLEAGSALLLVERTPEAIGDAMAMVTADDALRQRLAANGRAWAATHHDWARVVAAMDEAYRHAIAAGRARARARGASE